MSICNTFGCCSVKDLLPYWQDCPWSRLSSAWATLVVKPEKMWAEAEDPCSHQYANRDLGILLNVPGSDCAIDTTVEACRLIQQPWAPEITLLPRIFLSFWLRVSTFSLKGKYNHLLFTLAWFLWLNQQLYKWNFSYWVIFAGFQFCATWKL